MVGDYMKIQPVRDFFGVIAVIFLAASGFMTGFSSTWVMEVALVTAILSETYADDSHQS